jgi:hypothetical protein
MEEQTLLDVTQWPVDADTVFHPFKTGELMTNDDSDYLMKWFDTHQHLITVGGEEQYNGIRFMHIFNPTIRKMILAITYDIIGQIRRYDSIPVYPEMIAINRWHVGGLQEPHLDTYSSQEQQLLEDSDGELEHALSLKSRLWTSIINLNDNFGGGKTYIPECDDFPSGYISEQVRNTGLVFQGIYHEHGVQKVRRGPRYTISMWFTQDPQKMMILEPTKDLNLNEDTHRLQTFGY